MKSKFKNFVGIDISKLTLDVCVILESGETVSLQLKNQSSVIKKYFKTAFKTHEISIENTLICAEHTGHYSNILSDVMQTDEYNFWLADPYTIKHSQGIQRGKNDTIDAERIAIYASQNWQDMRENAARKPIFDQISYLNNQRELLMKHCATYRKQIKDEAAFFDKDLFETKKKRYRLLIKNLEKEIKIIDAEIQELLKTDEATYNQYEIIVSIDGIGPQTAIETLIKTEGFEKFTESSAFVCHCGCAPFSYESGSSIRSRNKVSHRADKNLKRLFHMAALSAIYMKGEMKTYFVRKVAEGKNKMSVINAVRRKLIDRIFALIKQNRKYDKIYIHSLA